MTEKLWFYNLNTCGEFFFDEVSNIPFINYIMLCISKLVYLFYSVCLNNISLYFIAVPGCMFLLSSKEDKIQWKRRFEGDNNCQSILSDLQRDQQTLSCIGLY